VIAGAGVVRIAFSVVFNKRFLSQGQGSVDKLPNVFSGHLMLRHYVIMQSSSEQERRKASIFIFRIFLTEEFAYCFGPLESFIPIIFSYLFISLFICYLLLSFSLFFDFHVPFFSLCTAVFLFLII
jgi:hypothetical protein